MHALPPPTLSSVPPYAKPTEVSGPLFDVPADAVTFDFRMTK